MSIYVDIEKRYGSFRLKTTFEAGQETLALLGASGCGKSLTLKCIAGIETPDRGKIIVDDVVLFDSEAKINLTPQQRRTGMMFQNYALFPNMTVLQNIQAGTIREKDPNIRKQRTDEIIDRFGLQELLRHYPHQLSGGQQQRTALARILVSNPNILLLDEPFSALDSHLRLRLEQEVAAILRDYAKTVLLVSHDRDEVYRLANSVAVMNNGCVEVIGEKRAVFSSPVTKTAAILTGCHNISRIRRLSPDRIYAEDWGMELCVTGAEGTYAGIRMHDITFGSHGDNVFPCKVVGVMENPLSYTITVTPLPFSCHHTPISISCSKADWQRLAADELPISIDPHAIMLLKG